MVLKKTIWDQKNSLTFFVKWYGYDESANSWEPLENTREVSQLHDYFREKSQKKLIPVEFRLAKEIYSIKFNDLILNSLGKK